MQVEEKLADFVTSLKYEDIPWDVIETTKKLLLDFAGLCYRGADVESSKALIKFLKEIDAVEEFDTSKEKTKGVLAGTGLVGREEYSPLANGCFAHSLELDDVVNEASIHPGVVVFPVALSVGERLGARGKEIIEASVAGYEVMIRVGKAVNPTEHYKRGFHPTGTCGTFAAAVVAAKLLGLKKKDLVSALGISLSQAASSLEFLADGAWTKRFHPGWSAHSGILAAKLAAAGFKGPTGGISGKYGFLSSYSDNARPELAIENLEDDKVFMILKTSIKPHACCRYNQSPIDAILQLVDENDIFPDKVEKVNVRIVGPGVQLVGDPIEIKKTPQNIVDAQFSLPYAAAIAIINRRAFLDDYKEELIFSENVRELMKKVSCERDPELEKVFPRKWPCVVEIKTKDGVSYEKRIDYPKGDPENPLTMEELIQKFKSLTGKMESEYQDEFIEEVLNLERVSNINTITGYLAK